MRPGKITFINYFYRDVLVTSTGRVVKPPEKFQSGESIDPRKWSRKPLKEIKPQSTMKVENKIR